MLTQIKCTKISEFSTAVLKEVPNGTFLRMHIFCQTISSDMKIMILKLYDGRPFDPIVLFFAVNLYLQPTKTI